MSRTLEMNAKRKPVLEDVTTLVPTLGRVSLRDCLTAIADGDAWPRETLLLAQGDADAAAEAAEEFAAKGPPVRVARSSKRGIPAAMNAGLKEIATPLVAVTHDDCRVAKDWLTTLTTHARQSDRAIVTGRVIPGETSRGDGVSLSVKTSSRPRDYHRPLLGREILFPGNMGFSMAVFKIVGPFDERPAFRLAGEDVDWCHRALQSGIPVLYRPDVVVKHCDCRPRAERKEIYARYVRAQGAFYAKHLGGGDLTVAVRAATHLLSGPWKYARGLLTGNWDDRAKGLAVCRELTPGLLSEWKASRQRGEDSDASN